MIVMVEYLIVALVTLLVEGMVKFFVDRYRMKRKMLLRDSPDRRIWDHKSLVKKL